MMMTFFVPSFSSTFRRNSARLISSSFFFQLKKKIDFQCDVCIIRSIFVSLFPRTGRGDSTGGGLALGINSHGRKKRRAGICL